MKNTYMIDDHRQDIENAMAELIISRENLRQRMIKAGRAFVLIPVDNLPDKLAELHKKITTQLTTTKAPRNMGSPFNCDVYATISKKRISSIVKIAKDIWLFYKIYMENISSKNIDVSQ